MVSRTAPGPAEGEAQWTVTDDGMSVLPNQIEQLFDPLCKTHSGRSGLGLALVRKFVQMHNGRIEVTGPVDGGLRIALILPKVGGTP